VTEPSASDVYAVRVERDEQGWTVLIRTDDGVAVHVRACADEADAMTYASTVRQHLYWLSPETFREYYRIGQPAEAG
jgi:hypothetical protein